MGSSVTSAAQQPGSTGASPTSSLPVASRRSLEPGAPVRPSLFSKKMFAYVWVPIVLVGAFHYGTASQHWWVHDVLRRAYYLPIVLAAFQTGLRGGLAAALLVSFTYLPHAFLHLGHLAHMDPGDTLQKALEIVLYNVVGGVAGYLADAERKHRVQLEQSLGEQQRLQRQLVRAGRLSALGQVVAGIAHEIKNPLHSLKGTAEVVDPLIPPDAEERRMWDIHVSELERLERIADRFLSFSSPKALQLDPLDLRDVAERVVELVGVDARKKGIELELELPARAVMVKGDRDALAQVALNIALNGVRALGDGGGRLKVQVEPSVKIDGERMHTLRIENDGPAIPENELEHLFDPFHGTDEGGTGLGLSISERIAEQHGGYIEAQNSGLGVRFTVVVPEG